MSWVVDTCLILDVLLSDASFGQSSANLIDRLQPEGLVVSPVAYIELAPAFLGVRKRQDDFLAAVGIDYKAPWLSIDTMQAHKAWARHIELKRSGMEDKRPIADILIGAYAINRKGLLTRNSKDFASTFPSLKIITPL
ncbi:MAG: type II toxin-antitoxin system VapC family toxin [Lentisphaerae bacterium]|jgi:predicted nucleic acid-binding protein|nr:type II toxin-antitoxin system VapC family toxin [Lentisphaerota bacterium]